MRERRTPPASSGDTSRVGRVSGFVGSRLVIIGAVAGVAGFALLCIVGFKLWQVMSRGSLGRDTVIIVVFGVLSAALLSIGGSAWRTGLRYLRGEKTVAGDVGRLVARGLERRRRRRLR